MFLALYFLLRITDDPKSVIPFLFAAGALRYTHASIILLVFALLFYLMIIYAENLKQSRHELEVILFFTFVIVWSLFIAYKNAFLLLGPSVIWQNIPPVVLGSYFSNISLIEAISQIGIVPLVFGIFIIYRYIFKERNKALYLLISFVVPLFFLLWFKLIEFKVGLMFLGVVLTLLFAPFYQLMSSYLERTKIAKFRWVFVTAIFIVIFFTSLLPSLYFALHNRQQLVSQQEVQALKWINQNTAEGSVVLATSREGYLITHIAERKNVADFNYLLAEDSNQRYEDIETFFRTPLTTEAVKIANRYDVDYIYFSDKIKT
jgi:hypothetical protein